jgi:hypothetical protein
MKGRMKEVKYKETEEGGKDKRKQQDRGHYGNNSYGRHTAIDT